VRVWANNREYCAWNKKTIDCSQVLLSNLLRRSILGQLEVFKLHDLPEDGSVRDCFVVVKYGPFWTRLPTVEAGLHSIPNPTLCSNDIARRGKELCETQCAKMPVKVLHYIREPLFLEWNAALLMT